MSVGVIVISDFGFRIEKIDQNLKLNLNSTIRIPQSAIELLHYSEVLPRRAPLGTSKNRSSPGLELELDK
jgi:hypothetical protein